MRITKARLDRYRKDLDSLGESASRYVEALFDGLIAEHPGASVAEMREAADEAIQDSLYAFGDQASSLALDLFDEIAEAYGIEADTSIEDVIDLQAMDSKVRYLARNLVDGDFGAFKRDIRDLTKYYVKRCAFENMERNCYRNDLRYARVPSGRETCAFCFMLSSRGFVYRSEQTAGHAHAYHENCDCVIVPGFKGLDPTDQVEGYDPDGMLDRWNECQAAAGSDSDLRDEWGSMGKKERAKYKGDSDAERYKRFVNAKAMREVETRDWRWLYTGERPSITFETPELENEIRNARPQEIRTAEALRSFGVPTRFQVDVRKYINEDGNEVSVGLSDFANGYEIKTLEKASTYNTINGYIKNASKKEDAKSLCFDNSSSAIDDEKLIKFIRRSQAFRRGRIYIVSSGGEYKFVR